MFWLPCISIYLCNENQLDALFTLNLFRQSTSKCFRHICSPSSGGILYIYNALYVYSTPPDDALQICLKHVEVDWRNELRINSASSWFLLHRCAILPQEYCTYTWEPERHYDSFSDKPSQLQIPKPYLFTSASLNRNSLKMCPNFM